MNLMIGLVSASVSVLAGLVVGFFAFNSETAISPLGSEISSFATSPLADFTSSPEPTPTSEPTPEVLALVEPSLLGESSPQATLKPSPLPPVVTPKPTPVILPSVLPTPATSIPHTIQVTPQPTPKPSVSPQPSVTRATAAQIDAWFTEFSGSSSVSVDLLRKIAVCESGYNQFARNGIYGGMFQFSAGTWQSTRRAMNADPNPDLRFDAREAIRTAAFRIATVGSAAWPNCD